MGGMAIPIAGALAGSAASSFLGGGGDKSKSRQRSAPKDMTPQEFVGLRPEVAQQFRNLFAQGGGQMFPGQMAAGVTGNEQQLLNQIMQQGTQPSDATAAGQGFLAQLLGGGGGFNLADLGGLRDIQGIQGGTTMDQMNPFLQQAIDAAQRPLIENFQDVVAPALRTQFTQAGQQIAGQGSSPFQMAAARAQSGLANAMGDIGTNLAFQDFAQRQGLASQEFQQLRDLMTTQELTGRGQDVAARGQDLQAQATGRQQQLDAVSAAAGVERQQLENLMASLEAQALPRMVEQLGIDRGLEEFRRREDQLLRILGAAAQVSSPTVAQVSTGSATSRGTSPFASAFGNVLGTGFGTGITNMFGS